MKKNRSGKSSGQMASRESRSQLRTDIPARENRPAQSELDDSTLLSFLATSIGLAVVVALGILLLYVVNVDTLARYGEWMLLTPLASGMTMAASLVFDPKVGFHRPSDAETRKRAPSIVLLCLIGIGSLTVWQEWHASYEMEKKYDLVCSESEKDDISPRDFNEKKAELVDLERKLDTQWVTTRRVSEHRCY